MSPANTGGMCIRCVLFFGLPLCAAPINTPVLQGLIVLEYIILNGSEQVAHAARENIFAIQTLKDFRMIDTDDRDQGQHGVCVRAPQVVACGYVTFLCCSTPACGQDSRPPAR